VQLVGNIYIPDGDRHFAELGDDLEHYQEPQRLKAFEFVTNWTCAVDLGAHVGIFSRHFAKLFETVVAFEPTPGTRECLEKNVPGNVTIIPFACGDREDTVLFRRHVRNSGGSELVFEDQTGLDNSAAQFTKQGFEDYSVRMITLDSLNLDGVGLVKIDVQGSEPLALRGAADTLRRCKPVVLIEEKPSKRLADSMEQIDISRGILQSYGYREGMKVGADRIYLCN
jgi:FkbM family methyltransferase